MSTSLDRQRVTVVESIAEVRSAVAAARNQGARIGFVPTMGALHAGHVSLVHAARQECDFVVASIFVNPTQFGPNEDFQKYPRDLSRDLAACEAAGVNVVFHPATETIYHPGFATFVEVMELSNLLEGKARPGHFRGVTTVVAKLFHIVQPDVAFFGQKDFQQQAIIRRMCLDLNLPVEIRVCPTLREPDGLAMSSRNVYLNPDERRAGLALSQCLQRARKLVHDGETDAVKIREQMFALLASTPLVRPDYATVIDGATLEEVATIQSDVVGIVAAKVGKTRLIDNMFLGS